MPKPADVSTKRLISLAPDNWVKWVTQIPDIVAGEILNSEFQWISRESDVLIRAESPTCGKFLVLNELQLRYKSEMPRRMRAYAGLAEEKYKLPIYPVLINILKAGEAEIPTQYFSSIAGLEARQDYRVINLWEVDVNIAFSQTLPSLLPFVPILKGGEDESIIREALRLLQADEQLNQLETVLAFFATFVLDSALVRQIMRWDMTVLRESPWYQEILREGEILGERRGEERGEERGERRGIISSIEMTLEIKFGSDGLQLMPQIEQISDLSSLKAILGSAIAATTLEEVQRLL
ncbi:Rpn family recombination-promoting nuclease/putative transposase [Aetokthonos hydrillicola Thurmond2011]|jgi:predicted transposase YdaD|uniref:Rpn family recombination-promoting nuclease/putative transposase n=1 Tax=Aetokthonos hydrillicola Thurmond2011 TaxID=2712845 RepID=A0AAP5IBJ9_9CYAN|nr:Rpn family recombination-promoting nuclease/putative transposase [Aetokthonos hydrillicola]MBO3462358.1 Rpn family recombination-promoting nuclease/putative transposase [Aetokthonos hydrillicola CCALA 1050]MBW4584225.1 Rpn family recombination-promoting nuclease/putative transposase [Aetokthonos hydrillicola CCALA 1050]MDR9898567.1 Rpn family recombination-promoting nuclease/putative transposase [Aetokthonos hydrillicola Thurmond2011]